MGVPIDVTVAIIKASWETRKSDALVLPLWSQSVLDEVFQSRNGWSLGSYWDQCSLGLRRFNFSFFSLGVLKGKQGGGREDVIPAARQQCKDADIPIEDYEHVIILVDPSNNDSGALGIGGDALFDQNGSHEFFAHELGHVLGLDHPFGYQNGVPTEYQDYYCLMGYTGPNSATLPAPTDPKGSFPPPPTHKGENDFWSAGRMPSAATLYHYWSEFRTQAYVQAASGAAAESVTLTALSEYGDGGPVLLTIPGGPGETVFVEYRTPSHWDKGFPAPAIVIHSFGVQGSASKPEGVDRVWFEHVIIEPFYDSWSCRNMLGIEVESADRKKATVRITRPAAIKSATLIEQQWQALDETDARFGAVLLSKDNDVNLCSQESKLYYVTVKTFGERFELELVITGFQDPVIEEWRINGLVVAQSGIVIPIVNAEQNVIVQTAEPSGTRLELGKQTVDRKAPVEYQINAKTITLTTMPKIGSYVLTVECLVRDRTAPASTPASARIATAEIHVRGERVEFDESYKKDAEHCWWIRTQVPQPVRHWPPVRDPGPLLPWVDPLDKHAISKLMQRVRVENVRIASPRIDPKREQ
jgi:hypothetical protein